MFNMGCLPLVAHELRAGLVLNGWGRHCRCWICFWVCPCLTAWVLVNPFFISSCKSSRFLEVVLEIFLPCLESLVLEFDFYSWQRKLLHTAGYFLFVCMRTAVFFLITVSVLYDKENAHPHRAGTRTHWKVTEGDSCPMRTAVLVL